MRVVNRYKELEKFINENIKDVENVDPKGF